MKRIIQIGGLFIVLGFLALSNAPSSYAQNFDADRIGPDSKPRVYSYETFVLFGDEALAEGDYFGASVYFGKALKMDSTDLAVHYNYASALANYNAYSKAHKAFYELLKKDNGSTYPDARYWLATMEKNLGNYEDAKENYLAFSNVTEKKGGFLHEKAKHEIQSCDYAIEMKDEQKEVVVFDLPGEINSSSSEFSPTIVNDSTLYYSSLRVEKRGKKKTISDVNNNIKIYEAEKQGSGGWKTLGALDTIVNEVGFHVANASLSPDKSRLYFTRCSEENVCAIYVSALMDGKWQEPNKLNSDINMQGSTATQPMVALVHGDEVLFFVSDRKGGSGKLDIWFSLLSVDSKITYGKAKPVEGRVNTKGDEITPYFDSQSNTLYFSSNWHYGFGGYDVFKSYGSYKRFTAPENLGQPYNSSADEYYFSINSNLTDGFFASNRAGSRSSDGEICCNDIYSFKAEKQEEEEKEVTILRRFLPASLYFHNDTPDPKSNNTGTQVTYLDMYNEYTALKGKYKKECKRGLSGDEAKKELEDIQSFFRDNLDKGIGDLQLFLDLLLTELQKGKKIQLTIRGYASPLAKTDYNVNLTWRRIASLVNYIRTVDEGVFVPYLDSNEKGKGHLSLEKIPLGEHKADSSVSANLDDKRSSVYSRAAALERKIEITSVDLEKN